MKKNILVFFVFIFSIFISTPSFAFDLYGWWRSDTQNNALRLIKIDEKTIFGMPYKVLSFSNDTIKISILNDEPTIIKINSVDDITISFPSDETLTYKCITRDTGLSKDAAMKIFEN